MNRKLTFFHPEPNHLEKSGSNPDGSGREFICCQPPGGGWFISRPFLWAVIKRVRRKIFFFKGRIYHAGCASSLYKRVEAESKKKMPMMTSSDELWPAQKLFSHFLWTWWMALVILRCSSSRRRGGENRSRRASSEKSRAIIQNGRKKKKNERPSH